MRFGFWLSVPLLVIAPHVSAQTTQTTTDTFAVSIEIAKSCLINSTGEVDFGTGVAATPRTVDAVGNVTVTCSEGAEYTLGLDYGENGSTIGSRAMTGPGSTEIPYQLYREASRTNPWGNDGTNWLTATGIGTSQRHDVYARATLSGTEPPGTYEDLVTATLSF